jgi:hypothetical protein
MLDPLPVGYYGLDEAMPLLAADISDQEVSEEQKRLNKPVKELSPALLHWVKRELAIQKLYAALGDDDLIALVRDPQNGELFRLTGTDWRGSAFWREIMIDGIVRASVGEEIARHEGRRVLLQMTAFEVWRRKLARSGPQPAEANCAAWLKAAMQESPQQSPKPKPALRKEATVKFGVSGHTFDDIWKEMLKITGANWGERGRPSKLPR